LDRDEDGRYEAYEMNIEKPSDFYLQISFFLLVIDLDMLVKIFVKILDCPSNFPSKSTFRQNYPSKITLRSL